MANNRYYIRCPLCDNQIFMGKSLGEGIYNMRDWEGKTYSPEEMLKEFSIIQNQPEMAQQRLLITNGIVLEELYDFMWKHMLECHKDELKGGKLFEIVSEYKE